ncbi:MAG: dinitrogenase iron-molybdenum cofactor biosynthesis protein [Clostridiales Family XIII bacterium]|jgi:predicted Fe-Mo cluster-binding NifX family protein|nr:dinitrogenase iron-molybdenum cofactor biosynthesis protein [Clostridiales Family XIII bacterium]
MNGKHRVAVATTDGLTLYEHFGHASRFGIYDIDESTVDFVETRKVDPPCHGGHHSESAFDAVIELLDDCEAIVVGKIGPGAADYLMERGIRVFEAPGVLEVVLGAIASRGLLDVGVER